jgi:hypothetical protein
VYFEVCTFFTTTYSHHALNIRKTAHFWGQNGEDYFLEKYLFFAAGFVALILNLELLLLN